jgi:acetolactate synthase-1/2/3 large subunit
VHPALAKADLILNVGHDVVEKPPFFMQDDDPMKVIHINFKPASVDAVYFPQLEVVGDIANSIWQIQQLLKKQAGWDFSYFSKVREHLEAHIRKDADSERFPLIPQRIVRDVREAVPSDGILCLDNGMYKLWFARSYKAHQPNTILLQEAKSSRPWSSA